MFPIVLTIICAVFMFGYIFFAAAGEQEPARRPVEPGDALQNGNQDAA